MPGLAVASEDMDSLTFGARRFLRHLTDLGYKKSLVTEFEVSKVASRIFSLCSFILLSILVILYDFPGFGRTWTHNGSVH
jgi:hypothetical protein